MPEQRFRAPLQPGPTGTVWRPAISQYDILTLQWKEIACFLLA